MILFSSFSIDAFGLARLAAVIRRLWTGSVVRASRVLKNVSTLDGGGSGGVDVITIVPE